MIGVLVVLAVTFCKMFSAMAVLGQWSLIALLADRLASRGAGVAIGAQCAFLGSLVLLRYLLLSLFNPKR